MLLKVSIINYISEHLVEGKVIEILGHKNDPGIDILAVAHKYDLRTKFSEKVLDYAEKIKDYVSEDEFEGRRRFTRRINCNN